MRSNPTPQVQARYGAPMGRHCDPLASLHITPGANPFTLRRIRLNGDYDAGGAYWGAGTPLYWWAIDITEGDKTDEFDGFFRAATRDKAKQIIRNMHPHARFYR